METTFPHPIRFRVSETQVSTFETVEITVDLFRSIEDPFRTVSVYGTVEQEGQATVAIVGFCDSPDGSVFRIRWMPMAAGTAVIEIVASGLDFTEEYSTEITISPSNAKGLLEAEGWGFRWSGTKAPFFWNATTAYMLAGLSEAEIERAIHRLSVLGVNRIRVALSPTRQTNGGRWYEPQVTPREDFTFHYGPWVCTQPDSQAEPKFDVTRFDIGYWRKFERLLLLAQQHEIVVQVIFFVDAQEPQNYPFDLDRKGDDPNELRYYQYAVARLSSFPNVEWCITNEWALFRPDEWVEAIGEYLAELDPYGHLCSVHGHGHFPFRASKWATHTLFQVWDEHGAYDWVLQQRREQLAIDRPLPIVNEEYGYEDHYPGPWGEGRVAPARNGDSRRRLAWEITMAGGHQTTGESAANGLGGWINGAGNDDMTMLEGYRHLRSFFEAHGNGLQPLEEPRPDGLRVLESPGRLRVVYCPAGEPVPSELVPPEADLVTYNPRTGRYVPAEADGQDWVHIIYLQRAGTQ